MIATVRHGTDPFVARHQGEAGETTVVVAHGPIEEFNVLGEPCGVNVVNGDSPPELLVPLPSRSHSELSPASLLTSAEYNLQLVFVFRSSYGFLSQPSSICGDFCDMYIPVWVHSQTPSHDPEVITNHSWFREQSKS